MAEEDGSEGPAAGYNSVCSTDHNRTSGLGCAAGPLGTQTDHGYEDALFAGRVQNIIQRYNQSEFVEAARTADAAPLFIFWAPREFEYGRNSCGLTLNGGPLSTSLIPRVLASLLLSACPVFAQTTYTHR